MFSTISSLISNKPQTPPVSKKESPATTQGQQLLDLVLDHSPTLMDSLELDHSNKANNEWPLTPLLAASPKRKAHAKSWRFDVDRPNEDGETLLIRTAKTSDYPQTTKKLLKAGANPNHKDQNGRDAINLNTLNGHPKALKSLLDHEKQREPLPDIRRLFAEDYENPEERYDVKIPLQQDKNGDSALHHAVRKKDHDALYLLTEAGVDPDTVNHKGDTPLHEAAKQGDSYACHRLIRNNANIQAQDQDGKTPLMHWVGSVKPDPNLKTIGYFFGRRLMSDGWGFPGFYKASGELLNGSSRRIDLQDKQGRTALSHLADSPLNKGSWGIAGSATLVHMDSNVDLADHDGLTPVMRFAKIQPKLLSPPHFKVFEASRDINRQDRHGKTALIHAAENGNFSAITSILTYHTNGIFSHSPQLQGAGLYPNIQDKHGKTALMMLANVDSKKYDPPGWGKVTSKIFKPTIGRIRLFHENMKIMPYNHPIANATNLLLLASANPLLKDHNGDTALMIAAKTGNMPVLEALSKTPETLFQTNRDGKTALEIAQANHQKSAVELLNQAEMKVATDLLSL